MSHAYAVVSIHVTVPISTNLLVTSGTGERARHALVEQALLKVARQWAENGEDMEFLLADKIIDADVLVIEDDRG